MLSYQWDSQDVVKIVFDRLEEMGFDAWMDIDDMSGNINEAMAAAVESSLVVVPFLTEKYQNSKNCKKELNYSDVMNKDIVPCMAQHSYRATGLLGLLTAGMLWIDFRNTENIKNSIESLVKELTMKCGPKLAEISLNTATNEAKALTEVKKGRAFIHIEQKKFLAESGEFIEHWGSGKRNDVVLREDPEDTSYWVQELGDREKGIVYFKNYHTHGYLGYDPLWDYIYTKQEHYGAEEWRLETDETDDTGHRAVVIYAVYGKKYLTVKDGKLTGVDEQTENCRWYLE